MALSPRLYLDRLSPQGNLALGRFIAELQRGNSLAPVTVVGPSTYANLTLRRELGRTGFANVRFLVLARLTEFLGAPLLVAQDRQPLNRVMESAALRSVASPPGGMLTDLRSHTSTHQALLNTFRQLRHASETALERLSRQSDLRREVVELYQSYRQRVAQYFDQADAARAAAEAVRQGEANALDDLGFIVFFQPRDLGPADLTLVRALAEAEKCAVFLGLTGDDEADAATHELAGNLEPFLGRPQPWPVGSADPPDSQGDGLESAPVGDEETGERLLSAPDPHLEIRWAIRQIAGHAEQGVPFHRMAILYRQTTPYSSLIHEELALAGIPAAGPNPVALSDSAAGRTLTGLLRLANGGLSRDDVTSWLTGCPVRPPGVGEGENFSASQWDAISKRAGIVGGREQWSQRLERFAENQERVLEGAEAETEVLEHQARAMQADAQAARRLKSFIEGLADDLTPPPAEAGWAGFSSWARGLLDRYLDLGPQCPPAEEAARSRVRDSLRELAGAQALAPTPPLAVFVQALEEILRRTQGHLGATGQGVFVAPVNAAAGMSFDLLHVAGMVEGAFPPPSRDDPLAPDRDRQAAGGAAAGLPNQQGRVAEERYAFLSALATAPQRTLSYPVANPGGRGAQYPSRWFLERASRLEGGAVYTNTLERLGSRPWLTVVRSMEDSLAVGGDEPAADRHDHDLRSLQSWKRAGRGVRQHPLAAESSLGTSLELGRLRYGAAELTEWDGNLSTANLERYARRLESNALSPTSLERWARCPFSYFLGNVLRIGALEKPEDNFSITALDRGTLVHKILEDFVAAVGEEGSLPGPGQAWSGEQRELMRRTAEGAFAEAESRGVTGRELLWQLEREEILFDLDTFLERDAELRERFGVSPAHLETRFGMGGGGWPEAVTTLEDGSTIAFRGVIDRVDTDASGQRVLVLDYKSGSARPFEGLSADPIDRGSHLQLAIYSLAARNALGPGAEVRAAYWFVSSRGEFVLAPLEPELINAQEVEERFKEGLEVIVDGIKKGVFPANPGPARDWGGQREYENCLFCNFKPVCPARKDVLWAKKRNNPLLAGYLGLSEGPQT